MLSGGKFLITANLLSVLRYMSTVAIVGMGLLLVIVVGEIDLSFGFLYGLCANTMAVSWLMWGWPVWLALMAAFAVAVFWGLFNAFFTTVVKIPSFIATLGSGTLIFGFTLLITNTKTFNYLYPDPGIKVAPGEVDFFRGLANQALPEKFPMQVVWMIVIALVFWFLLNRSLFGFRLKAIGGNPAAATLARLPVRKYKFVTFVIIALMACLAALLNFSFIGSTQPSAGQELLFPTFAAVIIGGASPVRRPRQRGRHARGRVAAGSPRERPRVAVGGTLRAADPAGHRDHRCGGPGPVHPTPAQDGMSEAANRPDDGRCPDPRPAQALRRHHRSRRPRPRCAAGPDPGCRWPQRCRQEHHGQDPRRGDVGGRGRHPHRR